MAATFYGMKLAKKTFVGNVTISWKQGAFLGIGGDRSQKYKIFNYETPQKGLVPMYVQDDFDSPAVIVCDGRLQYGMNNGVFFVVLHDKNQKPFQHRFIQNDIQKHLYQANEWLKSYTLNYLDLSWLGGDYLNDFALS